MAATARVARNGASASRSGPGSFSTRSTTRRANGAKNHSDHNRNRPSVRERTWATATTATSESARTAWSETEAVAPTTVAVPIAAPAHRTLSRSGRGGVQAGSESPCGRPLVIGVAGVAFRVEAVRNHTDQPRVQRAKLIAEPGDLLRGDPRGLADDDDAVRELRERDRVRHDGQRRRVDDDELVRLGGGAHQAFDARGLGEVRRVDRARPRDDDVEIASAGHLDLLHRLLELELALQHVDQ